MSSEPSKPVAAPASALPPGTRLGEFEILRILGIGGFGIVYLAFDHALEREVAVKEYMPASLAGRTETMHVSLRSESDSDTFALGLRSFVNEAKMLARFDHPSLLKVHRFWEANGTAYMAMPVISGRTFKDVRGEMAEAPDEHWLRTLLMPLLGAIEKLHSEGVYHRDIAPDNIVIEPDGRPVLLDFGAARRVISDKSQALTAILKPAYAPIEQYGEAGSVKQGPWTDLYALGATLHYMLLGRPPAPATARAMHDAQVPLSTQALPGCSTEFLHVVDWMLAPRPGDRPQSVAALRDVLEGRAAPPVRRVAEAEPQGDWERTQVLPPGGVTRPPTSTTTEMQPTQYQTTARYEEDPATVIRPTPRTVTAPPPTAPVAAVPAPASVASSPPAPTAPPAPPSASPAGASAKPSSKLVPALAAGVVLVGAAAFFLWPKPAPAPGAGPAASAPTLAAASAPAAVAEPLTASTPAQAPVVVAAASAAAPVTPKIEPPPAASRPAEVKPVPKPAPSKPAVVANVAPKTPEPVEPPRVTPVETPKPSAPPPSPVVTAAPEPPSAPARLIGPTERCGKRVFVALWTCIERECAKAELKQHPECVKWRQDQEKKTRPDAG